MKKIVKSTISFYRLLIEHSLKPYEPSPQHLLKRMLLPLCEQFNILVKHSTKNDAWNIIQGFSTECQTLKQESKI